MGNKNRTYNIFSITKEPILGNCIEFKNDSYIPKISIMMHDIKIKIVDLDKETKGKIKSNI